MIVKLCTWKGATCPAGKLIAYINRDQDVSHPADFELYFNTRQPTPWGAITTLEANHRYRTSRQKVCLYHEILSFSPEDSGFFEQNPKALEDLAQKYIMLRGGNDCIAYAKPHFDRHPHIHIVLSPVPYRDSSRTLRLCDRDFYQLREDLERYQVERYPSLSSVVFLNRNPQQKKDIAKTQAHQRSERNYHRQKRTNDKGYKAKLVEEIGKAYEASISREEFHSRVLSIEGVELNSRPRDASINGIKYGNKTLRWKTVGVSKEQLAQLDELEHSIIAQRIKELSKNKKRIERSR